MTEFEMAYLLTDMQSAIANQTAVFMTGVSGFLVGGYVAAHRLTNLMLTVAISLYTLFFAGAVFMLSRMSLTLSGLVQQIHQFAAEGKGLQWHSAASYMAPSWALQLGPYPSYIGGAFIYWATIIFFFHCRRVNRKAEAGHWKPKA
jgi:hypothetical protein